jgi:hypothetical protein
MDDKDRVSPTETDREEARKLCTRLDWMKINGQNDLNQWGNVLSYEIARLISDERRRCATLALVYADNHGQEIAEGNVGGLYAAILRGTETAKVSKHNTIEAVKKLQEALAPFIDDDVACEDPLNADDNEELVECEEAGKPREAWCAVCHARAVLGETENLIKELESNG